jgi:hypothetical protein
VQTYSLTDAESQAFVEGLLRGREGMTIATERNDTGYFVIVDCDSDDRARWVFEFVMTIDVDAVLLHTTSSSPVLSEPHEPYEFA